MSCNLPPDHDQEPADPFFDPDNAPAPEPRPLITFMPMDEIYVCADEALTHVMLVLTKHTFPPGTPPPAILFTPRGAAQLISLIRNVLHLVEKHPLPDDPASPEPQH